MIYIRRLAKLPTSNFNINNEVTLWHKNTYFMKILAQSYTTYLGTYLCTQLRQVDKLGA